MKKRIGGGFTLIEMLVAVIVIVLLVIGIGTGIRAAIRAYNESIFESECGTLSDILNTTVGDALRYSENVQVDGDGFTFTNYDYNVKNAVFTLDENGHIVITFTDADGNTVTVPAVNDGAYADGITVTALNIVAKETGEPGAYYFDVSYTLTNASGLTHDYTMRVRQANADVRIEYETQPAEDVPGEDGESPGIENADTVTVTYNGNVPQGADEYVFVDVFGNKTRSAYQIFDPKLTATFHVYDGVIACDWYTVEYFTTEKDGSGEKFYCGKDRTFTEDELTQIQKNGGVLELYAQWEAAEYTIRYEAADGSGSYTQNFTKNTPVVLYNNADGKLVNEGRDVTFKANGGSSDKKITAQCILQGWTDNKDRSFTLGQSLTPAKGFLGDFDPAYNEPIVLTAKWSLPTVDLNTVTKPTRTNCTFEGWYTAAKDGDKRTGTVTTTEPLTLYAHWTCNVRFFEKKTDTTTWKAVQNGYVTCYIDTSNNGVILPTPPAKTGYTFKGWYNVSNDKLVGIPGDVIYPTQRTDVYPQYQAQSVTISYDGNKTKGTVSGSVSDSSASFGGNVTLKANGFTKYFTMRYFYIMNGAENEFQNVPDASGKQFLTFKGWTTASCSDIKYSDPDSAEIFEPNTSYPVSEFIDTTKDGPYKATLYARWGYSGSVKYITPTVDTWKLEGWNQDKTATKPNQVGKTSQLLSANTTIYAVLSRTVTYKANHIGVSDPAAKTYYSTQSVPAIAAAPDCTGYTFLGWFTASDGGTKVTSLTNAPYSSDGSLTLYAHWQANTYTVKYDLNGGTGTAPAPQTVTYDTDVTLASSGGLSNKYTATFNTDGGSTVNNLSASRSFQGWNTKADGTGTSYTAGEITKNLAASGTVTLYAQWNTKSNPITLPETPKRGQDWFNGWTLDGATYAAGASVALTKDSNFTASWTKTWTVTLTVDTDSKYSETGTCTLHYTGRDGNPTSVDLSYSCKGISIATIYVRDNTNISVTNVSNTAKITRRSNDSAGVGSVVLYTDGKVKDSAPISCEGLSVEFRSEEKKDGCVISGTMITLADGTRKAIDDLTLEDKVLAFNHETGKVESAAIDFIENDGWDIYRVIRLNWSNGETTGIISEHGFFDLDEMKYVYIHEDDYEQYIGHRFYTGKYVKGKYVSGEVTLDSVTVADEYTCSYSFPSVYHLNFFADDMLSMPGGIKGMFNFFDFGKNLKYDAKRMQADIKQYGLLTYKDFEPYMSYEAYCKYPAAYLNVSLGKGLMTEEELQDHIARYAVPYDPGK